MRIYEIFIKGVFVDAIEAPSLRIAKARAALRFNCKVVVKERAK